MNQDSFMHKATHTQSPLSAFCHLIYKSVGVLFTVNIANTEAAGIITVRKNTQETEKHFSASLPSSKLGKILKTSLN